MVYKIPRGKHSAEGLHFGLTFKREIKFKASFAESCLYHFGDTDDYDVNKLFGYSVVWYHHHKQSARFGWRCLNGVDIEILTYTYNEGERQQPQLLHAIRPNQEFIGSIYDHPNYFLFEMDISGIHVSKMIEKKKTSIPLRYYLYPYFGGNKLCPYDMFINVEKIKF